MSDDGTYARTRACVGASAAAAHVSLRTFASSLVDTDTTRSSCSCVGGSGCDMSAMMRTCRSGLLNLSCLVAWMSPTMTLASGVSHRCSGGTICPWMSRIDSSRSRTASSGAQISLMRWCTSRMACREARNMRSLVSPSGPLMRASLPVSMRMCFKTCMGEMSRSSSRAAAVAPRSSLAGRVWEKSSRWRPWRQRCRLGGRLGLAGPARLTGVGAAEDAAALAALASAVFGALGAVFHVRASAAKGPLGSHSNLARRWPVQSDPGTNSTAKCSLDFRLLRRA